MCGILRRTRPSSHFTCGGVRRASEEARAKAPTPKNPRKPSTPRIECDMTLPPETGTLDTARTQRRSRTLRRASFRVLLLRLPRGDVCLGAAAAFLLVDPVLQEDRLAEERVDSAFDLRVVGWGRAVTWRLHGGRMAVT